MLQSYRRRQGRAGNVTPYARAGHMSSRMGSAIETYKRLTSAAAQLTAGLKSRGVYPKSTLQRKLGGSRVGRKIPATRARTAPAETGGYSQVQSTTMKSGRKPRMTLGRLVKEVHNKNESTTLRYSGMNDFNDNGYYWCGKNTLTASGRTDLPMYMVDLTSVNNTTIGGTLIYGNPMYRAAVTTATGAIQWTGGAAQHPTTGVATPNWFYEKQPAPTTAISNPHEKSRLLWTDVRLNLWGAKNKSIKYTVQVIKLLDDCIDPLFPATSTDPASLAKHTAFWQGMIKPYTFNPLALTSASVVSRRIKVLKTYETVIQATSSTENDVDPHVRVLKWFMRWDRDFNYAETAAILDTGTELINEADYALQNTEYTNFTRPKAKIWLLIRAAAYAGQTDSTVDNTVSPSFDACFRAHHIMQ